MILHSLKQIWRSLLKYKSFSIINLLGLSIGIASAVLIFLIADYEKRFDRLHKNGDDIFRVVSSLESEGKKTYEATVPYPTARLLRNEYPGAQASEIYNARNVTVRIGNQSPVEEKDVIFADSLFFNVFDFARIKGFRVSGNPANALSAPNKAILTESTARRYFGNDNPIGQLIKLENKIDVEVAAVV